MRFKASKSALVGLVLLLSVHPAFAAKPVVPLVPDLARPLPLASVRLTTGPLKAAQELDAKYLLALEPDRMMAYYRTEAGLKPKGEPYAGWDGGGRNLTGHIAGHYLSAVSLMWTATGDERFKQRADYLVREMREVQEKNGDGYLSAMEGGRACWTAVTSGTIRSGGFDLNGLWAPWYVLHKTYAGLRDAYRFTGNRDALKIEVKFAEWAEKVLAPLSDAQIQRMLNTEFGGMNEVLVDLYADTGEARWLKLSRKFEHRAILEPLKRHEDILGGKHGNTQIPKLIGSLDRYILTGDSADLMAAGFFFDRVARNHSYATGGHGKDEYFGEPDKIAERVDGRTAETCNVYNMLKLERQLFALWPDAHYADFQERALFNHILASIEPEEGATCYMVPVGRRVQHEYADMFRSFTCCVGTGMESHALHGDGIYYEAGDRFWVNLYAPSTVDWAAKKVQFEMQTGFPEGENARLKLSLKSSRSFTLSLRRPYWVGEGFNVLVNGETVAPAVEPAAGPRPGAGPGAPPAGFQRRESAAPAPVSTYVDIHREWKNGDTVEIALPKTLRLEATPDNPRVAALLWGPLVLAGDMGPVPQRGFRRAASEAPAVPVFLTADQPVAEWLRPAPGEPGSFRADAVVRNAQGADRPSSVTLIPFYRLHHRTYSTYWDLFTKSEWEKKKGEFAAEQERQRKLAAATVAYAQPGEMQPERDFHFQGGEDAAVQRGAEGRVGRRATSWFSFDLPVEAARPMALVVTYYSAERRRTTAAFEIQIDGKRLAAQEIRNSDPARYYEVEHAIPAEMLKGKKQVTVRFQAAPDSSIATVFGLRMIRANASR